jgi:hypothetical protein
MVEQYSSGWKMHTQPGPVYIIYPIIAVVMGLVLFLRLRSMKRARRLRLETLWIVPALYAAITAMVFYQFPLAGIQWAYAAVALAIGGAFGWRRGALMRIQVDPETHALNQQASPAAMLFIVVLILVRKGLQFEAGSMGFSVAFLTDVLMVFALGLLTATRLEMFLRARRLLAEARATAL